MMIPSNPYIAGSPIHGRYKFIGRQELLLQVQQTLRDPATHAIVLFGQRSIGKTSFLLHLEKQLIAEHEYTPIYFDLRDKASRPIEEVFYQLAQKISMFARVELPPQGRFDSDGQFFRDTFLPLAVKSCQRQGLVLLFDEFDVLDAPQQHQAGARLYPCLQELLKAEKGVRCIFTLGRRPEELSNDPFSTFQANHSYRISLLNQKEVKAIVCLSEKNGYLKWQETAANRVWYWAQGHPLFTQLLCIEVWNAWMGHKLTSSSGVSVADVDQLIDSTLNQGTSHFRWIWEGLPSLEQIVMTAMAETKIAAIPQNTLPPLLNRHGTRLTMQELALVLDTLVKWEMLRQTHRGVSFVMPLLQKWIASEKLQRIAPPETDSVNSLAENLCRAGEGFYKMGNLEGARQQLRSALDIDHNHLRARLLLGQVLIAQGNPAAAVGVLEPAYQLDPHIATADFVNALLKLADQSPEIVRVEIYERILDIVPRHTVALQEKLAILAAQAQKAEEDSEFEIALQLYQKLGDQESLARLHTMPRRREIEKQCALAQQHEEQRDWKAANKIYKKLLQEFLAELAQAAREPLAQTPAPPADLEEMYILALSDLHHGEKESAQKLLGQIIGVQPDYRDALQYLVLATTDVELDTLRKDHMQMKAQIIILEQQLHEAQKRHPSLEKLTQSPEPQQDPGGEKYHFDIIVLNARGEESQRSRGVASQIIEQLSNRVKLEMIHIPEGTFQMGAPETEAERFGHEGPQHEVTFSPFWMGRYPVTQEQWEAVMGSRRSQGEDVNPSEFKGARRPVEKITWYDAVEFCRQLSNKTGHIYRLPTEAEWEYACRGGTSTPFHFGETVIADLVNYNGNSPYAAAPKGRARGATSEVGIFLPNAFGLFDMHGNIWEWCQDWFDAHYYEDSPTENPKGPKTGAYRVIRGGSWDSMAHSCRSANRRFGAPSSHCNYLGFRLVRTE